MELLFPGLILVALMVYASTRIKKTAALAFEPETIETVYFVIEKPEGFLSVVNGDPGLEFEAYSREFGSDGAEDIKQARAEIRFFEDADLDDAVSRIRESATIISDVSQVIGESNYRIVEAERVEKGIGLLEFHKLGATGSGIRELKMITLEETTVEVASKIETMIASFILK